MGDRYYNSNQHNSFTPQTYGHSQSQQPISSLFDMGPTQGSGFSANTSRPAYNTGSSYDQRPQSNYSFERTGHTLSEETAYRNSQQYNERSPPSYEESRNDILISRSNMNFNTQTTPNAPNKYSPAWNYIKDLGEEPQRQDSSLSNLFDIPGKASQKSSNWSYDNYNSSPNYQPESQGHLEPYGSVSQQSSSAFSFDYGGRSDDRYETSKRRSNEFKQNYNRGRGIQNDKQNYNRERNVQKHNRGRDERKFREHRQNSGREDSGRDTDGECWKRRNAIEEQTKTNQEEVKPFAEDYGDGGNEDERNEEYKEEGGNEDEGNEEYGNDDGEWEKGDVFCPDPSLLNKYEYYPPSPEEMGKMFKDLVIYFFFKVPKNQKERNPFVVICESFRRSTGYAGLQVEDGFDVTSKNRKFCTLRYQGIMLVRGIGENSNLKEPRVAAGVELINNLAMSCYTLEAKTEYFSIRAFEDQQKIGDVPGVYRFVPESVVHDYETAYQYLMQISTNPESDEEHMFKLTTNEALKLKSVAKKKGLDARVIYKNQWIGISQHRTTQYWRDKILASGCMENAKYVLKPPQGIGNHLLKDVDIREAVPGLKKLFFVNSTLVNVYGPQGVGPTIRTSLPPWERRYGNNRSKNNKKKVNKIMDLVKQGIPLQQTNQYRHLSKKTKKKLRDKLGQCF